jgi:predicted  nucleic acid-binding Zn-ribbon protein
MDVNEAPVDRGDDLLPPDPPTNPVDDKAELDADAKGDQGTEGADGDGKKTDAEPDTKAENSEEVKPTKSKKTANERIQELIRRNKEREAELQRQIADLQKATSAQKTSESLEQAEQQLNDLEEKYTQLVLDGSAKEAAEIRKQMRQLERAISIAEARQEAAAAKDSVKAELLYDAAVDAIEERYPQLNPDDEEFDEDLSQEVLELHTAFVAKGIAPANSIQRAVKYVMADRGISVNDRGDEVDQGKGAGIRRALDTKNRNAAASKAQPPSAAKVGADSDAMGGGISEDSILKMSQEDFAKLSEEALAKMRGDFV